MKVLGKKILIKVDPVKTEKVAGLTIPKGNDGTEMAEVISIGSEVKEVEVGDKLIIHKHAGSEFTNPSDNIKYRSIVEQEIIVVL
jgi:co-chaperonin GroES (HSP10)